MRPAVAEMGAKLAQAVGSDQYLGNRLASRAFAQSTVTRDRVDDWIGIPMHSGGNDPVREENFDRMAKVAGRRGSLTTQSKAFHQALPGIL
jgi:hypothetical protein